MQIHAKKTTNNRTTEYPELKGIFKDHQVQLLAPNRTMQQSAMYLIKKKSCFSSSIKPQKKKKPQIKNGITNTSKHLQDRVHVTYDFPLRGTEAWTRRRGEYKVKDGCPWGCHAYFTQKKAHF